MSGLIGVQTRSKSFDTLIVFLKDFFLKKSILKKSADEKNHKNTVNAVSDL